MKSPELELPSTVSEAICEIAARESLESLEARALDPEHRRSLATELASPEWQSTILELAKAWEKYDHAIIRGLPPVGGGATTLLLGLAMDAEFKPYRSEKIVKHFKMSPWTTELSQTLRDGDFHTDLNTSADPPRVTLIHCREPDPMPGHGALRVARVSELLTELRKRGAEDALMFLLSDTVEMVDERADGAWSGVMASESSIRFHPATLRAAKRRGSFFPRSLECQLDSIRDAALAVSEPVELGRGDALFVSNVRALHYRGACTVRFMDFPRRFQAREIYVLHLRGEPLWPGKKLKT